MSGEQRWFANSPDNDAATVRMLQDIHDGLLDYLFLEGRKHGIVLPPAWLIDFMIEWARHKSTTTVLDPWSTAGLLVRELHHELETEKTIAILPEDRIAKDVINAPRSQGIDWRIGDPLETLDSIEQPISLIASIPMMGVRAEPLRLGGSSRKQVRDQLGNQVLLKSCLKLTPEGTGLFVVPEGFMFGKSDSVSASLGDFGLHLNTVLSIPSGAFLPLTSISTLLIEVSRNESKTLFVGQLTRNREHNQALTANLLARAPGEQAELGILIEPNEFTTFEGIVRRREIQRIAQQSGLNPVPLSEIALAINLTKKKEADGFDELENAVLLPLIGSGEAVTSRDAINIKAHNYAQIVLDPEKADATYVANFYNSRLGQLVRESYKSSLRLSKSGLQQSIVYLAPFEVQIRMLEVDSEIRSRISELSEMRKQLWISADELNPILERLRSLGGENDTERFQAWMETLPFPLASILWTYQSSSDDDKSGYEHLLHFFEALAEYLANILLSAYYGEPAILEEVRTRLDRSLRQLSRSTFGTWFHLTRVLSENANQRRSEGDQVSILRQLLKIEDDEALDLLLSPRLLDILKKTNELRNNWIGHSGFVNNQEAQRRHAILEQHLASVREIMGWRWKKLQLIRPGVSSYNRGVYRYTVELIMGTRTPFPREEIETTIPLEAGSLYLWSDGNQYALPLLPLIKLLSSPSSEQYACYFYNRVSDHGTARYVTYHYSHESEVFLDPIEVGDTLRLFLPELYNTDGSN